MAENRLKLEPKKGKGLFSKFENLIRFDRFFEEGLPLRYVPNIVFAAVLVIIYIGYHHYAEKTTRDINKIEAEVEDLRADYTTLKADYMYSRLQSEVAKRVKHMDLEEAAKPPQKLVVKASEY